MVKHLLAAAGLALTCGGCGGGTKPLVVPNIEGRTDLDPWHLIDGADAIWAQADMARLRSAGLAPVFEAMAHSRGFDATICGLDLWADVERIAVSVDADERLVVALSTSVVGGWDDCDDEGWPDGTTGERVGNVIVFGDPSRFDRAKRQLGEPLAKPPVPNTMAAGSGPGATGLRRFAFDIRGDDELVELRLDVTPKRGGDASSASMGLLFKKRMAAMAQQLRAYGDDAEPLVLALEQPAMKLSVTGVVMTLSFQPTTGLKTVLAKTAGTLFESQLVQCNRLIEVINSEQEPLRQVAGSDPAALSDLAVMLRSVAQKVGAVPLSDATLLAYRRSYVQMTLDLADVSSAAAEAMRDAGSTVAAEKVATMGEIGRRESELVDSLNRYCGSEP